MKITKSRIKELIMEELQQEIFGSIGKAIFGHKGVNAIDETMKVWNELYKGASKALHSSMGGAPDAKAAGTVEKFMDFHVRVLSKIEALQQQEDLDDSDMRKIDSITRKARNLDMSRSGDVWPAMAMLVKQAGGSAPEPAGRDPSHGGYGWRDKRGLNTRGQAQHGGGARAPGRMTSIRRE